jgi:hypothetical protein
MKRTLRLRLSVIAVALWIGLGAILFGVGGDDPSRLSLMGNVRLDGKPLDAGVIYFLLASPAPPQVMDATRIHHGHFKISDSDSMVPGTYQVRISGLECVLIPEAQGTGASLPTDPMPDRFNRKSELEVFLPHGGTFHLEFDLKQ